MDNGDLDKGNTISQSIEYESLYDGEKLQGVLSGWRIYLWGQGIHIAKYNVREAGR